MGGVLRRHVFNAFGTQSPQVDPFEQRLSPAEQDRRDRNVQLVVVCLRSDAVERGELTAKKGGPPGPPEHDDLIVETSTR